MQHFLQSCMLMALLLESLLADGQFILEFVELLAIVDGLPSDVFLVDRFDLYLVVVLLS